MKLLSALLRVSAGAILLSSIALGQWSQTSKLLPPSGYEGSSTHFGQATSLHDGWALVGAPGLDGAQGEAYLFSYDSSTKAWQPAAAFYTRQAGDGFGEAVALSCGASVIAAPLFGTDHGALHVFEPVGGSWTSVNETILYPPVAGANLGTSVAVVGDTIVAGAPGIEEVHVFDRVGGVWTQSSVLSPSPSTYGYEFGSALAFDGTTLVVGAPKGETAYVFARVGGTWSQQAQLLPGVACDGDFGAAVAVDRKRILVGAPEDAAGSVTVFELDSSGSWGLASVIGRPVIPAEHEFGASLALQGRTAVVGAPGDDFEFGSAHVYELENGTWREVARFEPDITGGEGEFGVSVSLDRGTALVNIGLDDSPVFGIYSGAANVWRRGSEFGWTTEGAPESPKGAPPGSRH